ncbi:rubrerythrin [Clostridium tepidiprofundi DSM 19306]|uniref:Rubrerythrin n=1 Tax=Clostridium tepidiprofundi DSM 19306 TaxID=1121338 RepID=A0A151B4Y5_9CLOT|nr:ferritin-like domain-containing protein [Clostridium tepidiprofundi]KYH34863.1 rubrerythrin [Clostridium tepidiprofundi DSM 19306]
MSYTTKGIPQGRAYYWLNKVRESAIGELVAINEYRDHISKSNVEEINDLWRHIMREEKRHYGMFLEIIRMYDMQEMNKFIKVKEHGTCIEKEKVHCYKIDSKECILNLLRTDIKGELEAIILYEQQMVEIPELRVREVYRHIVGDEKKHVEELTAMLMKYDRDNYGAIEKFNI